MASNGKKRGLLVAPKRKFAKKKPASKEGVAAGLALRMMPQSKKKKPVKKKPVKKMRSFCLSLSVVRRDIITARYPTRAR